MTKEEMEKQIHDFTEMIYTMGYEDGYKNGIADGNINDGTFAKKVQEAYENGLNDAWNCAWKMIIANAADEAWIFEKYSLSESLAKIKEYEKKHTDNEIKQWDEICDNHVPQNKLIVVGIGAWGDWNCVDKEGHAFTLDGNYKKHWKKTGKSYPELANILEQLKGDKE